ncbi:MAG: methionyl-tRNA formyltransferase [Candidatus Omnitrophica bacterium]|nr:methionyl-tRNA formyltransferase [Candidatus Omnitrophota bacterium]
MRVVFFGTAEFAVPSLEALASGGHAIVRCVTQPDRPRGRGLRLEPSPVKQAALRLNIPLAQPERLSVSAVEDVQAQAGVAVAYGQLIRRDVLAHPAHGVLGIHPSLLPKYRGAAPVAWALLNGDTVTGMTIFRLNERLDAGEMVVQERVAIEPHEPADALTRRLAGLGAQCLLRALELIERGTAVSTPQDEAQATLAPKLTKAQGRIDWNAPAETIERIVRATIPWPGASTAWRGDTVKIWSAAAGCAGTQAPPGTVVAMDGGLLAVSTGQGVLQIAELQPSGGRRMTVKQFLAGHPIKEGERFA